MTFDGSWDIGLQAGFGRVIRVNKTTSVDIVKEGWKYELPADGEQFYSWHLILPLKGLDLSLHSFPRLKLKGKECTTVRGSLPN